MTEVSFKILISAVFLFKKKENTSYTVYTYYINNEEYLRYYDQQIQEQQRQALISAQIQAEVEAQIKVIKLYNILVI